MITCDHCLLEVPERQAVFDTVRGQEKVFCCHGCCGVYRLIKDEGLEEFYLRRGSSWRPGPPDETALEMSAFEGITRQSRNGLEADIALSGIRCASCIWLIEKILLRTKGVTFARANFATHTARIHWDPEETGLSEILQRIRAAGYTPKPPAGREREEEFKREQRELLVRLGTAAFFSLQLMLYSVALYAGYFQGIGQSEKMLFQLLALVLTTPVIFYSGTPFLRGTAGSLKSGVLNMDVLITAGAGSAYLYSAVSIVTGGEVYFDTAAMIVTLILLGRYIEQGARGRASGAVARLFSLSPKEARKVVSGQRSAVSGEEEQSADRAMVPVSSVHAGDLIEVVPGERIPFDGIVVKGASEVDESMLTGESRPVSKEAGSEVFCGTQNLYGRLVFEVSRRGGDTVLAQIARAVDDAQARRAPLQRLADRVVGYFVPAVLLLSVLACIAWLVSDADPADAVMHAVSVLVIACPCALGLATPLAVLMGTTRGASRGILIKGGDVIERAQSIDTVVLDKTGTLTDGRPELVFCRGTGIPDEEALRFAVSLELPSEHSIAKAVVRYGGGAATYEVSDFTACPGKGVMGKIRGKQVMLGSRRFIESEGLSGTVEEATGPELMSYVLSQEASGATVVYLSVDRQLAGVLIIADRVRKEAARALSLLKHMGHDIIMITGDSMAAAAAVADLVGLDRGKVMAEKSPVEKAAAVRNMQSRGKAIMMAGDGINDGPALAQANVGVAMGRATDIALESADMVLMRDNLSLVPEALALARRTYGVIKQNLIWAFAYNMIALPLAVAGMLHPIIAALAMSLSSLSVVGNSLRLRRG